MATEAVEDVRRAGLESQNRRCDTLTLTFTDAVVCHLPRRDLAAHLVDDPALELHHQTGLVHGGQEVQGWHEPELGMTPAHERLEVVGAFACRDRRSAGSAPRTAGDPSPSGARTATRDGSPPQRAWRVSNTAHRTTAVRLGVVHRDVGIAQHVVGVRVRRVRSSRCRHWPSLRPRARRARSAPRSRLHPLDDRPDRTGLDAVEQHRELIAAEPCRQIGSGAVRRVTARRSSPGTDHRRGGRANR